MSIYIIAEIGINHNGDLDYDEAQIQEKTGDIASVNASLDHDQMMMH